MLYIIVLFMLPFIIKYAWVEEKRDICRLPVKARIARYQRRGDPDFGDMYRPIYTYHYDGYSYEGKTPWLFEKEDLEKHAPIGMEIIVFINPNHPQTSIDMVLDPYVHQEATIVDHVEGKNEYGSRCYWAVYAFEYNEAEYRGTAKTPSFEMQRVQERYPIGSKISIYVDPENPKKSLEHSLEN